MIALVLIVEGSIGAPEPWTCIPERRFEWAFRWTGRAVSGEAKRAEILCFGDSLVKLSVIPSVVRERTGKRVYNLALSGSQGGDSYHPLKRALESGAPRPEAVVVGVTPPAPARRPPAHPHEVGGPARPPRNRRAGLVGQGRRSLRRGRPRPRLAVGSGGRTTIRGNVKDALAEPLVGEAPLEQHGRP